MESNLKPSVGLITKRSKAAVLVLFVKCLSLWLVAAGLVSLFVVLLCIVYIVGHVFFVITLLGN